jgi:hypothetical protein
MSNFLIGLLIGTIGGPFAWEGLKYAFKKLRDLNKDTPQ